MSDVGVSPSWSKATVFEIVIIGSNPITPAKKWKCGRVRFIAPVLKTDEQKCSVSSNLTASAILKLFV